MDHLEELLDNDGATAIDALDARVREDDQKLALHYGEEQHDLTYGEVGSLSDSLAGNLARVGIAPGDRVSVFTRNPLIACLWMYGVWKAGAIFCPINFAYEGRLLAYHLVDADPALILAEPALVPALEFVRADLTHAPHLVVHGDHDVHGFHETAHHELMAPTSRPDAAVSFDDVANVIYTSGTTGPAKGVVQSHRWVNQYTWVFRQLTTRNDVVYNDLPMYHVGGTMANVVRALWTGASVSLWDRFSPHEFWRRVNSTKVTSAILLDVMIPWLMHTPAGDDDPVNPLNKAHMQPLPMNHHEFAQRFGIDFVSCGFGQTEAGNPLAALIEETPPGRGTPADLYRGFSHEQIRARALKYGLPMLSGDSLQGRGFMGRPTPFSDLTVVDEHDRPCPPGQAGELVLRPRLPSLIVREYLDKPEATTRAFRNLWFHTGDSATTDPEGNFYFLDRLGDRIRVRGENVSTFHVEDFINQHPKVAICAAFGVPSSHGDEDEIAVYLQPEAHATVDTNELLRWCQHEMPKFMRPTHLRVTDELPKTATNKIEKYKLRQHLRLTLTSTRGVGLE